ncbi:TonB-dependent receptor [Paraflavisolibacter sp. H34]|uniref:SusC/RagA family TonB-linked outer membrane protein n=1 Tax=Huijunlia imazamoxiresistens TaxID=3127457 RepID=UPI003018010E
MKQLLLAVGAALIVSVPVIASPHAAHNPLGLHHFFQANPVTGTVTNDKGEPLSGVTVQVKGTSKSTVTGPDGSFRLDAPANATLVFSYVGMDEQELRLSGQPSVQVRLKEAANTLTDVVVVGYGTQKKANLTGSVATVTGKTLTERPAPNAANLLQGRVTGLQVTQPSAEPGRDNPNFLIRGRSTFGGSTSPLVLIDGVTGSFNNLSPDDIENITVLKDAASASIYGARAANGVILVTTKRGRKGKATVSYRVNVARHLPTALPDLITNSAEYMEMYNKAAIRQGLSFKYDSAEIARYKNATDRNAFPNFDNVDYYINPATVTNHSLSVSGGNEKNTYNISLGYLDQNAMIKGYKFKRYNALLNYTSEISKAIKVGTIMNLTYKDRQEPPFTGEGMALSIYAAGPLYGPFLPDGSGRIASRAYQNEGRNRNPQEYYAMGWQNTKEYNINSQAFLDVTPLKGLTWSSKVALNYVDEYYKMYQHPYEAFLFREKDANGNYIASSFGPDVLGVTEQYSKVLQPTVYSTLTYDTRLGQDHNLRVLAGYEQLFNRQQNLRARRANTVAPVLEDLRAYTNDNLQSLYFTHPRLPSLSDPSEWAMQSLFGRINYDYKGKYLVEANIRRDGTSKVSPGYRWGTFPSVSTGWVISQEDFFRDRLDWVSQMKLRASYGTLGNQDVGTYLYQDNLSLNVAYPFTYSGTSVSQGAVLSTFRDQSIKWESSRVLDFGFDLNVRNGLLGVTFDWYRRNAYDILASQLIPSSLGLNAPTFNLGKSRSQGIELELSHQNTIGKVSYGVNGQFSTAKNKITQISVPSKGSSIRDVGYPIDAHYLYVWDGIFQVEDIGNPNVPVHNDNKTPKPGDLKMKDVSGPNGKPDGVIDGNDRVVVKGAYPDYIYSFGLNAGYKGFNLTAFFQGVQGQKNRVTGWGVEPFNQGSAPTTKWRNAWTPENRSNTLPAMYTTGYAAANAYYGSTYFLQDASYLRLKNVMLSYNFPQSVYSRLKATGLSVYVSADNVFTITDYEGGDPERGSTTGNFAQYPQARILNAGLNVKF